MFMHVKQNTFLSASTVAEQTVVIQDVLFYVNMYMDICRNLQSDSVLRWKSDMQLNEHMCNLLAYIASHQHLRTYSTMQ